MTTCLLVRHAHYDHGRDYLAGRADCTLSQRGKCQSVELARQLPLHVDAIESSPRRRCVDTILPYALRANRRLRLCSELDEIDYGAWTGRSFASLANDPSWRRWNERRSEARPEGGEAMHEAQTRTLTYLRGLGTRHAGTVIAVTHAEIIRAVVLHCQARPLDAWHTVEIPLASVTHVEITPSGLCLREEMAA